MQITEALERRTVDYVERGDKEITIACTDGHQITLFTDEYGDIQLKSMGVKITLNNPADITWI